ncbi:hypothetical protein BP6252_02233 [Coleophoma cylindrospora]|uniref:Uncharacterized protein n=1 Tax=Coleophoma cylindrospora TaxID=1849047 RepID=A0A3D8SE94_9HELO|nr:hypothetical protein BP6252_02233 [Coleophoma cylindrospora]
MQPNLSDKAERSGRTRAVGLGSRHLDRQTCYTGPAEDTDVAILSTAQQKAVIVIVLIAGPLPPRGIDRRAWHNQAVVGLNAQHKLTV